MFLYMCFWFGISRVLRRNDIADTAWGLGFLFLLVISLSATQNFSPRTLLACALVTLWSLRLSTHIFSRNTGKGEDARYIELAQSWGKWFFWRSFLQVFLLQGFLLLLTASALLYIIVTPSIGITPVDIFGVVIWIVGFLFESIADRQLAQFVTNQENRGKLIQTGLWKYSRHPNYFGEIVQWWGIWCIALSLPYGAWTIFAPLTITFLITKVSGIPLTEARMQKKEGYEDYRRRVSILIPLLPKKPTVIF